GLRWWPLRLSLLALPPLLMASLIGGAWLYDHFAQGLPEILTVARYRPPLGGRFYAHDGARLADFALERRALIPLSRMPRHLIEAFIASEDQRFFSHDGVDLRGTLRALLANVMAGRTVQGASTLTQQLAKTLVGDERSYRRKAREAILARRMESRMSKAALLYLYLNHVYLGHGAYGVEAAAQNYFRRHAATLSLAEAAMIAGLPPQPGRLNPVLTPDEARQRQRHVLARMVELGFISPSAAATAAATPLKVFDTPRDDFRQRAPHFVEQARQRVQARYGYEAMYRGGLEVHLSVDLTHQRLADEALRAGLGRLGRRQGYVGPLARLEGAALAAIRAKLQAAPPPKVGQRTLALVTSVSRDTAQLEIGAEIGALPLEEARWATPYDPKSSHNRGGRLADLRRALQPGDLIDVEILSDAPITAALRQTPPVEGALISLDPRSGYVSALIGGDDFDVSEYSRALQACRQPGSVFKPIIYALGLTAGMTLGTLLDNSPVVLYDVKHQYLWKPHDAGESDRSDFTLYEALIHSRNRPAIRALEGLTPEAGVRFAQNMGITTPLYADLSLVLGSSCVTLWDMTRAFAVFALRGGEPSPILIKRVLDRDGLILEDHTDFADPTAPVGPKLDGMLRALFEPRRQLLEEDVGYLMQYALRGVITQGTARKAAKAKGLTLSAAGKTGTTDKYDVWFIGFTADQVAGVWVGADHNQRPLGHGEHGSEVSFPIWIDYMSEALRGAPPQDLLANPPEGVRPFVIDKATGLLHSRGNQGIELPFRVSHAPRDKARPRDRVMNQRMQMNEERF
ncbi:transglycosylase domain-containing protein, partial [Myxococcota bacterium]|nr:transglycosylase domain-containing protein [Myxococcota bacterium]